MTRLGNRHAKLGWAGLGFGLAGGFAWSVAVEFAMPSWLDKAEACSLRFGHDGFDVDVDVEQSLFPPSATCTFSDLPGRTAPIVRDYIPAGQSALLAVLGLVAALITAAGVGLLVRQYLTHPAPTPDTVPPRKTFQAGRHVLGAAFLGIGASVVGSWIAMPLVLIGGVQAMALTAAAVVVGVVVLATAWDAASGPGTGDLVSSRRRGVAVGGIGSAVVVVAIIVGDRSDVVDLAPLDPTGTGLLAGIPFAAVAALQWIGTARPAQRA